MGGCSAPWVSSFCEWADSHVHSEGGEMDVISYLYVANFPPASYSKGGAVTIHDVSQRTRYRSDLSISPPYLL